MGAIQQVMVGLRASAPVLVPNLFTGITNGTPRSNFTGVVGGQFFVDNGSSITVDALCRWKIAGNSQTHTVYLVAVSPFSIIASVSIDMSTGSAGSWVSVNLSSPQLLSGNASYGIFSAETNGGDQFYNDDTTVGGTFPDTSSTFSIYDVTVPPTTVNTSTAGALMFGPVNAIVH